MHQGNWKCSGCGGAITELPFQPRSESGLTCRACYAKGKEAEKASQPVAELQTASEPMPTDDIPDFDDSQLASGPMPADDAFAGLETMAPAAAGEKPKISGSWQCSVCGGEITSLPFTPRDTSGLKCLDCFKKSKQ
jgi:CxxC-x17-CxxC domain-containing protein